MNTNSGLPGPVAVRESGRSLFTQRAVWVGAAVLLVAGCAKPSGSETSSADKTATNPTAATADGEKRYPLTGEILRVEAARKVLVVTHDEIKGYMPAMTMEFVVSPGDIAVAKPGQKIRAEMISSKTGDFRLEKIWPNDKAAVDAITAGEARLREDTHNRGKNAYNGDNGDTAVNFVLYDQSGKVVQSAGFRGKQIMVNFIFTRCPVATMCPAATSKMISVQKLAKEAGVNDLELVSITLDPEYDTPGILKEYADVRGIDTTNFSFLTGPDKAIRDLLAQFGVIAEFKGDLLQHTLATLLIDREGKIIHRADGSVWEPKDFVAKMKKS